MIVLLSIVAVFVLPDFNQANRSEQLEESLIRSKALMGMCRAQAMNESRRYRVIFGLDGNIRVLRQRDPITAPDAYDPVADDWADMQFVLEEVWVEAILKLPEGPPPLQIEDDKVEFTEIAESPPKIEELDEPVTIEFTPDGASESIRWVFRDTLGRGRRVTVDGRIGRFAVDEVDRLPEDQVHRPRRDGKTGTDSANANHNAAGGRK